MLRTFFSFSGRIGRQTFWLSMLALIVINLVVVGATAFVYGVPVITPNQPPDFSHPYYIASVAMSLLMIWPSSAISVKRLHDRNMRGWWLLLPYVLMIVPLAGMMIMKPAMMAMMAGGTPPVGGLGSPGSGGPGLMIGFGVLYVIAVLVLIWLTIVIGFLRGTNGPNRFGPDPLGGTGADAPPAGSEWAS